MRITKDGYVGIGITNPEEKLHVDGNIQATKFVGDGSGLTGVVAQSTSTTPNIITQGNTSIEITDEDNNSSGNIIFTVDLNQTMKVINGKVGIGTTNPQYKLDIAGSQCISDALHFEAADEDKILFTEDTTTQKIW